MATDYYRKFIEKLQEIFMMDHAELDFGIYRIMNQKREEINRFLEHDLLPQVKQALQGASGDADAAKKRMAEIEKQLGTDIDNLPDSIPMVGEYKKLKAQLAQGGSAEDMQGEVFSHLVTFFSRYYDGGDFISKRRYKDNTYAIPYNGEEVKLHWANSDQYYIKTSEYFRDYTFVLPTSRRKVHFVLRDATTEQNNNKAASNMERRFALYQPEGENGHVLEVTAEGDLNIYFTYELMPKTTKQKDLMGKAMETVAPQVPADFAELLTTKMPTKDNADRTLLEKHLTDYTAKNSFDYFIHKDLGGFLSRELDFYIKNEVLHIDDLDAQHINSQLTIVKAIKQVGLKIIQMLAQLENFQKKLWLKKKFVVQSDYCITLDRVPEKLYPEIIANDAQRKEWIRLFAIDEIKGDLHKVGYSDPLTIEFLKQNPFLVLDTAFFDAKFKHQLVKSMENIDEQTNGLLINSENFQALELLQKKYRNRIKCTYIDPPYNTSASKIAYKNNYEHSSWLSLMQDRITESVNLMSSDGVLAVAIDDAEGARLNLALNNIFGEDNKLGQIVVVQNPGGRHDDKYIATAHEYCLYYGKDTEHTTTNYLPLEEEDIASFKYEDEKGMYRTREFRRSGNNSTREARPKMYYPLLIKDGEISLIDKEEYSLIYYNSRFNQTFLHQLEEKYGLLGFDVLYPIDPQGIHRVWRWGMDSLQEKKEDVFVEKKNGQYIVKVKDRLDNKEGLKPKSVWYKPKYTGVVGTDTIKNMGFEGMFSYPKSPNTVIDSIDICSNKDSIVLDYFAGSATTAHAVISLNKIDEGKRKFIVVEVNTYFDKVTRARTQKAVYSKDWDNGKPVSRDGISQCFKYIRLEQYEDTLNNLEIKKRELEFQSKEFQESYMLSYLLDTETRDSLLNLKWFENPFAMTLKTTKDNELIPTKVDMVETFNYLIGLNVETEDWHLDDNICVVQGKTHRDGLKTLVIWRNCKEVDNEKLCNFFDKMDIRTRDTEFDVIYVNGDNTLPNMRRDEEHWKVVLTEEEFAKRMFEEE